MKPKSRKVLAFKAFLLVVLLILLVLGFENFGKDNDICIELIYIPLVVATFNYI